MLRYANPKLVHGKECKMTAFKVRKGFFFGLWTPLVGTHDDNLVRGFDPMTAHGFLQGLDLIRRNHLLTFLGQVLIEIQEKSVQTTLGSSVDSGSTFGQALFCGKHASLQVFLTFFASVFIQNRQLGSKAAILSQLIDSNRGPSKTS